MYFQRSVRIARCAAVPARHALRRTDGVRAFCRGRVASADLLAGRLGFATPDDATYLIEGERRRSTYRYDDPPARRGIDGAGSVHHVAWSCDAHDQMIWRQRVIGMGARVTPVLERGHWRSIYFREPSGVLFEVATRDALPASELSPAPAWAAPTAELALPAGLPRARAA